MIIALLTASLLPCGCGGDSLAREVTALLAQHCGEVETIGYVCMTEDGERLYREEFELRFPDDYRYRFYEDAAGEMRLRNITVQSGSNLYRVRAVPASSESAGSLEVETESNVPPLRCTGTYLALYHLVGNVDYFQSMIALLDAGSLVVSGSEDLNGVTTFRLESASGLQPRMVIWVDGATGLPLAKELALSDGRVVTFSYDDYEVNQGYTEEPFPPDALPFFDEGLPVSATARDGACQPVDMENAPALAGFTPLVPQLPGFDLSAVYLRDPMASDLTVSEENVSYPEGFRELYLVLCDGVRQVEIRESPYDPEFAYYTTGMAALSGAFLTSQEEFGDDAGNATYTAAIDCQEMRLTLQDIDVMVTGDLSRDEFEDLAIQLKQLSR
jgi:hypothetical protein